MTPYILAILGGRFIDNQDRASSPYVIFEDAMDPNIQGKCASMVIGVIKVIQGLYTVRLCPPVGLLISEEQ